MEGEWLNQTDLLIVFLFFLCNKVIFNYAITFISLKVTKLLIVLLLVTVPENIPLYFSELIELFIVFKHFSCPRSIKTAFSACLNQVTFQNDDLELFLFTSNHI